MAPPFCAETIHGYLVAMHQLVFDRSGGEARKWRRNEAAGQIEGPWSSKYNQSFESIYAMVPASLSMLLALFPAILMALAIVREKELARLPIFT